MKSNSIPRTPLNLQFFADPPPAGQEGGQSQSGQDSGGNQNNSGQQATNIDYAKIQQMLDGTLAAKEETALKAFFKQQGMTEDEGKAAIAAFKEQKANQQPDAESLKQQLAAVQAESARVKLESSAIQIAVGMGIDPKIIPYLVKMSDMSDVLGDDGEVKKDTMQEAINKVLEDIPQLKPQSTSNAGFIPIGAPGKQGQQSTDDELYKAFNVKAAT